MTGARDVTRQSQLPHTHSRRSRTIYIRRRWCTRCITTDARQFGADSAQAKNCWKRTWSQERTQELTESVSYIRGAAGADSGICVRGRPPVSLPFTPLPFLSPKPPPSLICPSQQKEGPLNQLEHTQTHSCMGLGRSRKRIWCTLKLSESHRVAIVFSILKQWTFNNIKPRLKGCRGVAGCSVGFLEMVNIRPPPLLQNPSPLTDYDTTLHNVHKTNTWPKNL